MWARVESISNKGWKLHFLLRSLADDQACTHIYKHKHKHTQRHTNTKTQIHTELYTQWGKESQINTHTNTHTNNSVLWYQIKNRRLYLRYWWSDHLEGIRIVTNCASKREGSCAWGIACLPVSPKRSFHSSRALLGKFDKDYGCMYCHTDTYTVRNLHTRLYTVLYILHIKTRKVYAPPVNMVRLLCLGQPQK